MAGKNEVSIWIRAKDLASTTFRKLERNLNAAWASAKNVGKGLAVAAAGATALTVGLGKLAQAGGKYVTVSAAFSRNVDDQSAALRQLQQAAGGMISKFDLMQGYNQAIALGSAKNVDEFAQMIQISQQLSRSLGLDLSYALESLNTGIARQSKRWLDNLGIIIDVEAENEAYAATLGKQAKQLSENEKREAFRAAALREGERIVAKMGESTGGAGDAWVRLETTLADARDRFGEIIAQSPEVQELFDGLALAIETLVEKLPSAVRWMAELATVAVDAMRGGPAAAVQRGQLAGFTRSPNQARFAELTEEALEAERARAADLRRQIAEIEEQGRGFSAPKSPAQMMGGIAAVAADERAAQEAGKKTLRELREELETSEETILGTEAALAIMNARLAESRAAASQAALDASRAGGGGGGGGGGGSGVPSARSRLVNSRAGLPSQDADLIRLIAEHQGGLGGIPSAGIFDGSIASEVTPLYRKAKKEAEDFNATLLASVGAFQALGTAAVSSSRDIEDVLLPSLTNMAAALASELGGGIAGAMVGAVGGIIGAVFDRNDRPRVIVDEYSSRAQHQMRQEASGPATQFFLNGAEMSDEEVLRRLGYNLQRRERLLGGSRTGAG